MVIDRRIGFIGGSGIADHWLLAVKGNPRWRDSMYRIEGDSVASLQATFVENWLEASNEILTGVEYFPFCEVEGQAQTLIVNSSPSFGRSTRARILFQTLLASAK